MTKIDSLVMQGVSEYAEGYPVELALHEGKLAILAYNEGGHNCTLVDLDQVVEWVKNNESLKTLIASETSITEYNNNLDKAVMISANEALERAAIRCDRLKVQADNFNGETSRAWARAAESLAAQIREMKT